MLSFHNALFKQRTHKKNIPANTWLLALRHTSNDVFSQGQDLEVLLLPQLVGDGAEDTDADQLALLVHEDHLVVVELDLAVVAAPFLHGDSDDHAVDYVSFLDLATRLGLLYGSDDHVPEPCSFLPPQGLDAHHPLGPGVIDHLQVSPRLDECSDLLKMG
jgi:hypothetical protein